MEKNYDEIFSFSKGEAIFQLIEHTTLVNDEKELNFYMNGIKIKINEILKNTRQDLFYYYFLEFLNNKVNPVILGYSCDCLKNTLIDGFDDLKFEKEYLKILKRYLRISKLFNDYNNLSISYLILMIVIFIQLSRRNTLEDNLNIYECELKGINYIPPRYEVGKTNSLKEDAKHLLKSLKTL